MARAQRIGRWVLIGLTVVGATVVLLRMGLGLYLRTSGGREAVAERISSVIGLPVEVADIELGTRTSSVKFRLLDPALGTSPDAEILSVESATADVSFVDILTGRAYPKELHLHGVRLSLRLDASGKILTTLPDQPVGPGKMELPTITMDTAQITVRQDGRPEFHFTGLGLQAIPAQGKLSLSGSADDPSWGKWRMSGEVDLATKTGWVDLVSDDVPVTTAQLRSIPFIPQSVGDNLQPNGHAQATGHFEMRSANDLTYDIRVQPKGIALGIPAASVSVTELAGVLRLHDGLAELYGIEGGPVARGKVAGGAVTVSAKMDYSKAPAVVEPLMVRADRLVTKDLPVSWGLKSLGGLDVETGLLSGVAKLKLVAQNDRRIETYGEGQGVIDLPHIFGGEGKIEVSLGGNGQRLDFHLGGAAPAPPPRPARKQPGAMKRPPGQSVVVKKYGLGARIGEGLLACWGSEQNIVLSRRRYVLPVCYTNIVQLGDTTTNYQVQPGDRIYVPGKGLLEGLCQDRRCRREGPCCRVQVGCWNGGCGTVNDGSVSGARTIPLPLVPAQSPPR